MGRASPTILQLWSGITATNSPPTLASDGLALPGRWDDAVIIIRSTAGTNPTVTAKLWVYSGGDVDQWSPLGGDGTGSGTGTLYGVINTGVAIQTFDGTTIRYTEPVTRLSAFKRIYLELTALTGGPTLGAFLDRTQEV